MIKFLIKAKAKAKLLAAVIAVSAVIAAGAYFKGVYDGRKQVKDQALGKTLNTIEVQNEVRNHRIFSSDVARRLRRGTF